MASSLLALIDDIASVLDDVALLTKVAAKKTSGVLGDDLAPDTVARRFDVADFWRPVFDAGDALVFAGDVLHRTHVDAAMTQGRHSLELRYLDGAGWPARLTSARRADVFTT